MKSTERGAKKYSELNLKEWEAVEDDISEKWQRQDSWRTESLKTITGQLFTLNSGGVLGSLAYLATKGNDQDSSSLFWVFWLFLSGTLLLVARSAYEYYVSEHQQTSLDNDISALRTDEIDRESFIQR